MWSRRSTLFPVALALALVTPARAAVDDDPDQISISAKDLHKYFEPYVPAVRDCYAANASGPQATGNLRLELVIHRDGSVFKFGFAAPGVTGAWLRKLDGCLRALSETWHFPVRRGFTTAVLPFVFQRTTAPGAGPFPDHPPTPAPGTKP
jgi:hypothetical protein